MRHLSVWKMHWQKPLPKATRAGVAAVVVGVIGVGIIACGAAIAPMEGSPRTTPSTPPTTTPGTPTKPTPNTTGGVPLDQNDRLVRIALSVSAKPAKISTNGEWSIYNGKRYRGEILLVTTDSGMIVINRLPIEQYLRGVVPLEIGPRTLAESAAVQAQAVAARSYSYLHINDARAYDMMATVQDQVYGGVDAERPYSDAAVRSTSGMVLMYARKVVNTPYHSTCGGKTASISEVWYKQPDEPYLRPVDDTDPRTGRSYCEVSPKYKWTREFTASQLANMLGKYLRNYVSVRGEIGSVRSVSEQRRTPSGRLYGLVIDTDNGRYALRGNDMRFVLRAPNGEILNSTNFTVESQQVGSREYLTHLTVHGTGYGHGIGMCQWGAIARARAGQNYKTILRTYYPGTTVGHI